MAFVPHCQCDVFVSYATANNQSFEAGKHGWVTRFRDALQIVLDESLGRRGLSEVWMDYKLRGNEPFDEQLRDKVSRSAVLLVVLSNAHLASDWCRRELEIFAEAAGGGAARAGRIFLVHYEPVPHGDWPPVLDGLSSEKYRFFRQERDGAPTTPLGYPVPSPENPSHVAFYDRLRELVPDLARTLRELAGRGVASNPPPSDRPAVFLGEVCGETLYDQRRLVKSHLEQSGLRVLPTRSYGRTPTEEMDKELAQCKLFVQMLGRFGGGYEPLHHQRAVAAGLPVLRWRSRDLDLATVDDSEHRKLLEGADVQAMDFEELKRTTVDRLRVLSAKRAPTAIEGEHFVLVNADMADKEVADAVVEQLVQWNVGYDVVYDSVSLRDVAESTGYNALLVIYGSCSHDWVRGQLIKCREILLINKSRAPACAVYIGPPPKSEPLRCRPPRVAVIDTDDKNQLQAFIQSLPAQEITA